MRCVKDRVFRDPVHGLIEFRGGDRPIWFQLYVLKDRGFMRNALERAQAAGVNTLVFTVDMPVPGARYRYADATP